MSGPQHARLLILTVILTGLAAATLADDKKKAKTEKTRIVPSGFLGDYSDLEPDPDKKNLLLYRKGDGSMRAYRKFIIDQPLIYFHSEAQGVGVDPDDLAMLSTTLRDELVGSLEEGGAYEIVEEAGEGVAHMRLAITDVVPIDPKKNVGTKAAGMAFGVGLLIPRVDLGSASVEAEILDSESGERLVAVVAVKKAKRFGGVVKGSKEWGDAKAAFKSWAKQLRKRLDKLHQSGRGA